MLLVNYKCCVLRAKSRSKCHCITRNCSNSTEISFGFFLFSQKLHIYVSIIIEFETTSELISNYIEITYTDNYKRFYILRKSKEIITQNKIYTTFSMVKDKNKNHFEKKSKSSYTILEVQKHLI